MNKPQILAPAGDQNSFLAAIAAGADAIYCGLKIFSARMEAANFSVEELNRLTRLAHSHNVKIFLALNSIIKESELNKIFKILCKISTYVDIDGLIIQDPAVITIARKAGFKKDFHLSTLGNCTSPSGIRSAGEFGFKKIVLPRELNIDEIKAIANQCPDDISLEAFIHGALCYSVSGRCYWSSWFGGKSALRGRCVQPCRRIYEQKGHKKRHFSCMDFSADVLVKVLRGIPQIDTWKIEGRKKSPHYVYYTVMAYKLLRDDPKQKKQALSYLNYAMGREFTHYNLLSQRTMNPLDHNSETGSGLFAGRIRNPQQPYFMTREALYAEDLIRIGYEGDKFHDICKVTRAVPKKGKYFLSKKFKRKIKKGTPVYLIDRREGILKNEIQLLAQKLTEYEKIKIEATDTKYPFHTRPANKNPKIKWEKKLINMELYRGKGRPGNQSSQKAVWLSGKRYNIAYSKKDWLWIDPVLFPKEDHFCINAVKAAVKKGVKHFVLNAPWQLSLFESPQKLSLWAGPFCNIANTITLHTLKEKGFSGAFVSPELDGQTLLSLPKKSPLPLGVVIYGNWPMGISRILSPDLKPGVPFLSPMGETAWVSKFNNNYHLFPNWLLDLTSKRKELFQTGYSVMVQIHETIPKSVKLKKRPGLWNWDLNLL